MRILYRANRLLRTTFHAVPPNRLAFDKLIALLRHVVLGGTDAVPPRAYIRIFLFNRRCPRGGRASPVSTNVERQ
jgi:hypothetical protein